MIRNSERKQIIHCILNSIYMATAYNPGAAIVFHAPKSCSHIAYDSYYLLKKRLMIDKKFQTPNIDNLFVTNLSDKEAIFGGEKLLLNCLLDIANEKKPAYIIVVSGCAAGVIGDDIQAVAETAEHATKIPILAICGAGFMNKQNTDGLLHVSKLLVEKFAQPRQQKKDPSLLAVFGENQITAKAEHLTELKRLFSYFGYKKFLFPPAGMSPADFQQLPQASLVTAVGIMPKVFTATQLYAEAFAQNIASPFLKLNYPTGLENTCVWLKTVGAILNQEVHAELAIKSELANWNLAIAQAQLTTSEKVALLVISLPQRYFALTDYLILLNTLNIKLLGIVFLDELTTLEKNTHRECLMATNYYNSVNFYTEKELPELIQQIDFALVTKAQPKIAKQICLEIKKVGISSLIQLVEKITQLVLIKQRRIIYE